MRTRLLVMAAVVAVVSACARHPAGEQKRATSPREITMDGCVEQGATSDEFVLKGRSVDERVVATTGSEPGGVPDVQILPGGDGDRNPSHRTREDWADRISPKLIGTQEQRFRSYLGDRVVATGQFVPASMAQPLDEFSVRVIAGVSNHCATP